MWTAEYTYDQVIKLGTIWCEDHGGTMTNGKPDTFVLHGVNFVRGWGGTYHAGPSVLSPGDRIKFTVEDCVEVEVQVLPPVTKGCTTCRYTGMGRRQCLDCDDSYSHFEAKPPTGDEQRTRLGNELHQRLANVNPTRPVPLPKVPELPLPIHIGACIVDGKLHITANHRDKHGNVFCLAMSEMKLDSLVNHDVIAEMSVPGDEDHPNWCLNEQVKSMFEGIGASEDHTDVKNALRRAGFFEDVIETLMWRICKPTEPTGDQIKRALKSWFDTYGTMEERMRAALKEVL